jgi:hypothetical protein
VALNPIPTTNSNTKATPATADQSQARSAAAREVSLAAGAVEESAMTNTLNYYERIEIFAALTDQIDEIGPDGVLA